MGTASPPVCTTCQIHAEAVFRVEGMDCNEEVVILERRLRPLAGLEGLSADLIGQRLHVTYDAAKLTTAAIVDAVGQTGMRMWLEHEGPGASSPDVRARFWLALASGAGMAASLVVGLWSEPAAIVLLIAATIAGGVFPVRRALVAARTRTVDINVLMVIAVAGALTLGEWFEAASVVFLFALAQWLEARTLDRARQAIRALIELSPREAIVRRDGAEARVPVETIRVGEEIVVRPGDKVPLDGRVRAGRGDVNEAPITGESLPVDKGPGDEVFAGTINGRGSLDLEVIRVGRDTRLARIIHLVEAAQVRRAPVQSFVDRFARIYTPVVIALAVLVATVPALVTGGDAATWFYRSLVLLVVACPCALVISTPVTVVSALTGAARKGILIKSGIHLETMGKIRVVALDKTGTLTEGVSEVAQILPWRGTDEAELIRMAAAAESRSEHPIGRAIMDELLKRGLLPPEGVEMTALPGRGVRARHGWMVILLGSPRLFREEGLLDQDAEEQIEETGERGGTMVLVGWNASPDRPIELRGALLLMDRVRPEGTRLLAGLREAGVERVVLMSGDRTASVEAAAREAAREGVSFDEWKGELLPAEKVEWIRDLRSRYGPVLMVGDGVNDAPALAAADVGMAMGSTGTAAALDTADIALMEDNLSRIPTAFRLGRKAAGIIRANVAFALAVKVVFVLLGGTGHATLWMAVVADMGSSLIVILNGLRTLQE
jgi:Cd2+/Zn2+-exporting ATPase